MESERKAIKPISPNEVAKKKLESIPDVVIESFNEMIAENYNGSDSVVLQKDVVNLMESKGLNSAEIYKRGWLDVEEIYRKAHWKVEYDKPGYNESYEPSFRFSKIRRNSGYSRCDD